VGLHGIRSAVEGLKDMGQSLGRYAFTGIGYSQLGCLPMPND
jgi:hypothetical protein